MKELTCTESSHGTKIKKIEMSKRNKSKSGEE
jgi:hypothetical protein